MFESQTPESRSPTFETLEPRVLMSLLATVDAGGVLTVRSSDDDAIVIFAESGNLKVNGADPSSGPIAAGAITGIRIEGGPGNNNVNLAGVTPAGFTALEDERVTINGGVGDDTIIGSDFADLIDGGFGDDSILAGLGDDQITGGDGDDTLHGSGGIDKIIERLSELFAILTDDSFSGDGADLLTEIEQATISGTGASEQLDASLFSGQLTVDGGAGNDTLIAGTGGNLLIGGIGRDAIVGGIGNDTLQGGRQNDTLDGADGNDQLLPGTGRRNIVLGGAGLDSIDFSDNPGRGRRPGRIAGTRVDLRADGTGLSRGPLAKSRFAEIEGVTGSKFNDRIVSALATGATINGGEGNDRIRVRDGNNFVVGGDGNDRLRGGSGSDTLLGGAGNDRLINPLGGGWLDGSEGSDTIRGGAGDELISGGTGNDRIHTGGGNDTVDAGEGIDTLDGVGG